MAGHLQRILPEDMPDVQQLVQKSSSYVEIYRELVASVEPTKSDRFLESVGLRSRANRRRLERIRMVTAQLGTLKEQARSVLTDAIGMAKTLLADATRLNKTAIGTLARAEPEIELMGQHVKNLLGNYPAQGIRG